MDNVTQQAIMETIHCVKNVRICCILVRIFLCSIRILENTDQKKSNTDISHAVIISMQRKNCITDTRASYKELTKYCIVNISTDDTESRKKFMIDNGILENRPSNQGIDSFLILNSNVPISPSRNDIE